MARCVDANQLKVKVFNQPDLDRACPEVKAKQLATGTVACVLQGRSDSPSCPSTHVEPGLRLSDGPHAPAPGIKQPETGWHRLRMSSGPAVTAAEVDAIGAVSGHEPGQGGLR